MPSFLNQTNRFLSHSAGAAPRTLVLAAVVALLLTYFVPLWNLTMFAPQYPDGLTMDIYSYRLVGGNNNQDVKEINILNHYIGMRDLTDEDFTEFKWMPFVIGGLGLVMLRAAVYGSAGAMVDVTVLFTYFGLFSLWSFAYKLYVYGHNLAPTAAVKVPAFMPPVFGFKQIANFEVYSYPQAGTYAMAAVFVLLFAALAFAWRDFRRSAAA
jgi:hypothetical protein